MFIKSAVLPALLLNIAFVLTFKFPLKIKILTHGLLFSGALFLSLYLIKGSVGLFRYGGMEVIPILPLLFIPSILIWMFAPRILFPIRLISVFLAAYLIAMPLVSEPDVQRWALAFSFLTLAFWMFADRQLTMGGWTKTFLLFLIVITSGASLWFLTKSSAMLAQIFGMFACYQGMSFGFSLVFGPRTFGVLQATFLVALPVMIFLSGMIYL
jgi:hypothetical protein